MFGRGKPRTIQQLPSRYLNLSGTPLPDPTKDRKGPSVPFVATVAVAGLAVIAGVIWMSRQPAPSTADVPVFIPETTEQHKAIGAILDSAQEYMTAGRYKEAAAILDEAVRRYADDQDLRVANAQALVALDRPADAYTQMEAALAIGPRPGELEFLAGTIASKARRLDRAVEHYSMAQTADPLNPQYPLYLGQTQRQLGEIDAAKASLMIAANVDPESAIAWGTLADIALEQNKTTVARQHIERARRIAPTEPAWIIIEARCLKRAGEVEKALILLNGLDQEERVKLPVLRLTAECYGMLKRPGDAAGIFAAAVEVRPRHPELAFEAAVWFERAGDAAQARTFAERAAMLGSEPAKQMAERLAAPAPATATAPDGDG